MKTYTKIFAAKAILKIIYFFYDKKRFQIKTNLLSLSKFYSKLANF